MNPNSLATGTRSILAMLALTGLLTACGQKSQETATEPAAPAASSDAATTSDSTGAVSTNNVAYVSNEDDGVTKIDLATLEPAGKIDVQAQGPRGIGITEDGKLLVTANKEGGNISIIDTATGKVVRQVAIGKNPEFVRIH
ncbi:MAG TPA: beta-propeller fold lactonase family protein, partial [Methylophilaceae bacterium]|nr:beta-propeller fold lactonase family protein [Methylophilaceae bacterium]